jgi:hypothetical protein
MIRPHGGYARRFSWLKTTKSGILGDDGYRAFGDLDWRVNAYAKQEIPDYKEERA